MTSITVDSSQSHLKTFKLYKVLEKISKPSNSTLDVVIPHFEIEILGDSYNCIDNLFKTVTREVVLKLDDFLGEFDLEPHAQKYFTDTCTECQDDLLPCCFSTFSRTALIIRTALNRQPFKELKVLDIELGRFIPYHLHAFTFGEDGHCIAYVKRGMGNGTSVMTQQ